MKRQSISVPPEARTPRHHPGFTLIELLVVVAIIAILASLLLPTLARAKKASHLAACTSNLRQMGVSIQVYTVDHEDDMPLISERYWGAPIQRGLMGGGHGWTMHGVLLAHTDIPMDAFRCPADRRDYELTESNFYTGGPGIAWTETQFDYAANCVGHGMRNRRLPWSLPITSPNPGLDLKQSAIPNPSDIFMVWDAHIPLWTISNGWAQLRGHGGSGMIIQPIRVDLIPQGTPHYDTTYRHAELMRMDDGRLARLGDKGPNVVLADGHVEKRINLSGGPWNDDNFNLPVN